MVVLQWSFKKSYLRINKDDIDQTFTRETDAIAEIQSLKSKRNITTRGKWRQRLRNLFPTHRISRMSTSTTADFQDDHLNPTISMLSLAVEQHQDQPQHQLHLVTDTDMPLMRGRQRRNAFHAHHPLVWQWRRTSGIHTYSEDRISRSRIRSSIRLLGKHVPLLLEGCGPGSELISKDIAKDVTSVLDTASSPSANSSGTDNSLWWYFQVCCKMEATTSLCSDASLLNGIGPFTKCEPHQTQIILKKPRN